jgi:chromosome segregation ATPase
MKVKEVYLEKLFSLEKYNNERIGFRAEVSENENPDKVAGELFFKIMEIEDCLQIYRNILSDLDYATERFQNEQENVRDLEKRLKDMKVKIEEISQRLAKGELDVDEKLRHACDRESYKKMQEDLAGHFEQMKRFDELVKQLTEAKVQLRDNIRNGNFSLSGINVPIMPRMRYY